MIAVRWGGIVTILAVVAGLWFTQTHNGLIVLGLVAAGFVAWSYGVFTRDFWVADEPASYSALDRHDHPAPDECPGCLVDHSESTDDEEKAA